MDKLDFPEMLVLRHRIKEHLKLLADLKTDACLHQDRVELHCLLNAKLRDLDKLIYAHMNHEYRADNNG